LDPRPTAVLDGVVLDGVVLDGVVLDGVVLDADDDAPPQAASATTAINMRARTPTRALLCRLLLGSAGSSLRAVRESFMCSVSVRDLRGSDQSLKPR
jgi:hypothetical protein